MHIFVEPSAGTQPVLQVIRDAKRSVVLNSYLITDRTIIRALKHAERRGIHVRVILEKNPYHMRHYKARFQVITAITSRSKQVYSLPLK